MRKPSLKKAKSLPATEMLTPSSVLDDDTIRALLRDGYEECQQRAEDPPAQNSVMLIVVQAPSSRLEPHGIIPNDWNNEPELLLYWNLHIQKQVLYFEQECYALLAEMERTVGLF